MTAAWLKRLRYHADCDGAKLSQYQGNELTPARKCVTTALAINLLSQMFEIKSRYDFQDLPKYCMIISHSPFSLFDSMICGESIISKRPTKSGYFYALNGTAVNLTLLVFLLLVVPTVKPLAGDEWTQSHSGNEQAARISTHIMCVLLVVA